MVAIIKKVSFFVPFFCYVVITNASADYQWVGYSFDVGRHSTPLSACQAAVRVRYALPSYGWAADFSTTRVNYIQYQNINPPIGECGVDLYEISNPSNTNPNGGTAISRVGNSCDAGKIFNPVAGICEASNADPIRKQTGTPPLQSCATSDLTFTGNPINFSNGNKFQAEVDYRSPGNSPITVIRYYNSLDGIWRHSYSTRLTISYEGVMLTFADGRQSLFSRSGNILVAEPTELGELKLEGAVWTYTSPANETYIFEDATGKLTHFRDAAGRQSYLAYENNVITITDDNLHSLILIQDSSYQPLSISGAGVSVAYEYNSLKHLTKITKNYGDESLSRIYRYELPSRPGLLTGIIDERGIRAATWTYDDKGRATSSEHANGVNKIAVQYNEDGSTTVVNELGKRTVYHFGQFEGVNRVVSVKGEPSPNCPISNSSYTYDDRGQVKTKTNAKGFVNAYTYNERGLEIERVEASGTPLARTVLTEWDPSRPLPTKIIEANRTIFYTYDGAGQLLSQQISAN